MPYAGSKALALARNRPQVPTRTSLGLVLRGFREKRGLSQEELGFAAKLHRNYIRGVELGERNPSFESLARWLTAVGVTWREFGETIDRRAGSSS